MQYVKINKSNFRPDIHSVDLFPVSYSYVDVINVLAVRWVKANEL